MDRMAVDGALAALCAAFALCVAMRREGWVLYLVLAAAALTRDTGLMLPAAWCCWLLLRKRWAAAALYATAILPALAWYRYVGVRTPPQGGELVFAVPLTGAIDRFLHPMRYANYPTLEPLVIALDFLAVAGTLWGMFLAIRTLRNRPLSPTQVAMLVYTAVGLLLWRIGDWPEASDHSRILSPLLLLLGLDALCDRRWLAAGPLFLVLPRVGVQLGGQLVGIVKGIL